MKGAWFKKIFILIVLYDIIKNMIYKPPYTITPHILSLSQNVTYMLGMLAGEKLDIAPIQLRRDNTIKTIQSSLAIEGNTLSLEQVTHMFDGKRVIGPKKDIIEVQNALHTYAKFDDFNPLSLKDFLYAHELLMKDLIHENGKWRTGGVGIFKGAEVTHVAPPAKRILELMHNLFEFLKKDRSTPWLLKACIFHYELEFIHPFQDGNGRMGRLWQHLLLVKESPVFKFIAIEELIKKNQEDYYRVLSQCDKAGDSTYFIEFSLNLILIALEEYRKTTDVTVKDSVSRLSYAKMVLSSAEFSRKDYMNTFKNISSATASRDLRVGIDQGLLVKRGDKNQTRYRYAG